MRQLAATPAEVLQLVSPTPIFAASLAYFAPTVSGGSEIWRSYLEGPPPNRIISPELTDDEYRGLVVISQLFPVYRAMSSLEELSDEFAVTERGGLMTTQLPLKGASVGIPVELYALVSQIDGPLLDRRARQRLARSSWELVNESAYPDRFAEVVATGERLSVLTSGLSLFTVAPDENETPQSPDQ